MGWRTVVVNSTCKLDFKMGYLCMRTVDDFTRIHISEISTLIVETTAVSFASYLLMELTENKVNIIFCDSSRRPHGQYLPFYGSHNTSDKIRKQVEWSNETKRKIWKSVIYTKITGQSKVLEFNNHLKESEKLLSYLPQIEPGDKTNREGHAAKVYFNALFGMGFVRTDESIIINPALNYGYSILLSAVSREIASNGYLTQIGIFHDNMFNELNLASDLMEPFRPFVDQMVLNMDVQEFGTDQKHYLANLLNKKVIIDDREQYIGNAIAIYIKSILDALSNDEESIIKFPKYEFSLYESDSIL